VITAIDTTRMSIIISHNKPQFIAFLALFGTCIKLLINDSSDNLLSTIICLFDRLRLVIYALTAWFQGKLIFLSWENVYARICNLHFLPHVHLLLYGMFNFDQCSQFVPKLLMTQRNILVEYVGAEFYGGCISMTFFFFQISTLLFRDLSRDIPSRDTSI